jgi:molecular chaperone DnaJ
MAAKRDYYDVLGIDRGADEAVIKSAYRKKAMQYHPDRNPDNPDAEEKFKEATEAYEILKDPQKRQMYDQFGHAGLGQGAGGFGGGFAGFEHFDLSDALRAFMRDFGGGGGSIFEEFFGGMAGGRRRRSNRGDDLRIRIPLTLEEVASGVTKKVRVNRLVHCETCAGSGVAEGASKKTCPQCKGAGQVRTVSQTILGTMQQVRPCNMCRGTGEIISDPCKTCHGEGLVRGSSEVEVKVPAGVASGNYMTIDNMGNQGPNRGEAGDLMVVFEEKDHDLFSRHGDNVLYEMPISFTQAALGAELNVPTLNGDARLKIPSGTQSGKVLKLRGKGIPHLHSPGKGDQLVQVTVWVPEKLSNEDKELLRQLDSSEHFTPPKSNKSFFEKLRETLGV